MIALRIKRGDTWRQTFRFVQDAVSARPVDLTGCSARLQVRRKPSNLSRRKHEDTLLLDATDSLTIDALAGTVTVDLQIPDYASLGKHYFDVEITYSDGHVQSTDTAILDIVEDQSHG